MSLAYNLDAKRVNMFAVWLKLYDDFFLNGLICKFSLGRHGLTEVVKYSIIQEEKESQWRTSIIENSEVNILTERLQS